MSFFTPEQIEMLSSNAPRVDLLVKMEFKSSTIYAWNGEYEIIIAGNTYLPMHGIAQIEGLGQITTAQSQEVTITLSGIPTKTVDFLSLATQETPEANQQALTIYLQLFDNDWIPIGVPIGIWWGFMQPPEVSLSEQNEELGAVQTLTLNAENAFFNKSRPRAGRYTDRDQQSRFPNDKFYQFASSLVNKTITYPDY